MKLPGKSLLTLMAIAVVAAAIAVAWALLRDDGTENRYKTQAVERADILQNVAANGTLNPVILVNVGTQVSGTVRKLHVDFNARVDKGQVLAELDDVVLSAQLGQSQANLKNAQASLELAIANEQRIEGLFKQEYASRQDLDAAIQARKSARAQVEQFQALTRKDRANLDYTVIRSPVSGVVVDRQVDVGQTVAASFQTPTLFKIAQDLSKMQIDSSFAEADIGLIKVGQAVRFSVDAFPNRSFQGKVRQIRLNPTTQANVVTYNVVVAVDNPGEILLPGMTAYVSITVNERSDVLAVPNAALRFRPAEAKSGAAEVRPKKKPAAGSATVYVLEAGTPRPVAVTTGITDSRNTEVVAGDLRPGQLVITGDTVPTPQGASGSGPRVRMF